MKDLSEEQRRAKIRTLLPCISKRALPIVREGISIQDVIKAMIEFEHSRILYVVNEQEQLTGVISLGILVRQVFAPSHEPQIHARSLVGMITAETAKDIMQTKPIFAHKEEEVGSVLKKMIESNVKEIPIVDEARKLLGNLTMIDLLKFLSNSSGP